LSLPDIPCRAGGVHIVGINPSLTSAAARHYYQGRHGRRLWSRLEQIGLLRDATHGREDEAFSQAGNGLTDLVKRPTRSARDLSSAELAKGVAGLQRRLRAWKPRLVLFVYRPPAVALLGRGVAPGRCPDLYGIATFLLTSPYVAKAKIVRVDSELRGLLRDLPIT
jgi:TDG/mug DNA glycosylase family protein